MFFGGRKLVAVDIGTSSVKIAQMESSRKGFVLNKFAVHPINAGTINGGEIIEPQQLTQAIQIGMQSANCKAKYAATGMWGTSVIIKKISMPKMEEKLIPEQIKWEAEQYIPFDINEISLDFHLLKSHFQGDNMEVLLVAAKQEFLYRIVDSIEAAKLKCSIIDVSGFALANCFEANYGPLDATVALLHIGAGVTHFVVIDKNEVVFCRDIPVGGLNHTSDINKSMGVSHLEAEALKISATLGQEVPDEVHKIIASTNEQIIEEIKTSFEFFVAAVPGLNVSRLFVSGGSIFLAGLLEGISNSIGVAYEIFDPFLRIGFDKNAFSADDISKIRAIAPVAMGLSMRKVGG